MIEAYLNHVEERKALGVPAKPLDAEQTKELVKLLQKPPTLARRERPARGAPAE